MKICLTAITIILLVTVGIEASFRWKNIYKWHSKQCSSGLIYLRASSEVQGVTFRSEYYLSTIITAYSYIQGNLSLPCNSATYANLNASLHIMINVTNEACAVNNQPGASQTIVEKINKLIIALQQFQQSNQGAIYADAMQESFMYQFSIAFNGIVSFMNTQAKYSLTSSGYNVDSIKMVKQYKESIETYKSFCRKSYISQKPTMDKTIVCGPADTMELDYTLLNFTLYFNLYIKDYPTYIDYAITYMQSTITKIRYDLLLNININIHSVAMNCLEILLKKLDPSNYNCDMVMNCTNETIGKVIGNATEFFTNFNTKMLTSGMRTQMENYARWCQQRHSRIKQNLDFIEGDCFFVNFTREAAYSACIQIVFNSTIKCYVEIETRLQNILAVDVSYSVKINEIYQTYYSYFYGNITITLISADQCIGSEDDTGELTPTTPASTTVASTTVAGSTAGASSTPSGSTLGSTVGAFSTPSGSTVGASSTPSGSTLDSTVGASSTPSGSTVGASSTPSGSTLDSTVGASSTPSGSTVGASSTPSGSTLDSTVGASSTPSGSTVGASSTPSESTAGASSTPSESTVGSTGGSTTVGSTTAPKTTEIFY